MGVIWKSAYTYLRHLPFGSPKRECEIGVLLDSQRSESRTRTNAPSPRSFHQREKTWAFILGRSSDLFDHVDDASAQLGLFDAYERLGKREPVSHGQEPRTHSRMMGPLQIP
jgi:hypothetical protein